MKLLSEHRRLLGIFAAISLCTLAVYLILILPIQNKTRHVRREKNDWENKLKEKRYPLNPPQLRKFDQNMADRRDAVRGVFTKAYFMTRQATPYNNTNNRTVAEFQKNTSHVEFLRQYNDIKDDLEKHGLPFNKAHLGMDENMSPAGSTKAISRNYQLVTYIWFVRHIALLAKSNGLSLADTALIVPPAAGKRQAAPMNITILPLRSLKAVGSAEPYMEEYSVHMKVTGDLRDLTNFIAELTRHGRFMPLVRFEVRKIEAEGSNPSSNSVEATLTCAYFFMIKDQNDLNISKPEEKKVIQKPLGA